MKTIWLLLLLSPVLISGCVLLPNMEPHKQTVQKGTPPQVNPELPGGKKTTTVPKRDNTPQSWDSNSTGSGQKPFPSASSNYAPITPEQVNEKNAHQVVEQMKNQISGPGASPGTPGMNYNHSTNDLWPR